MHGMYDLQKSRYSLSESGDTTTLWIFSTTVVNATNIVASTSSVNLTGVTSFAARDLDIRPATGQIVLLAYNTTVSSSTPPHSVYTVNPVTGVVTLLSTLNCTDSISSNEDVSIDFNPTVDRLRIISSGGTNLRVNVVTGDCFIDSTLNVTGLTSIAYTNNLAGATTTTLYAINQGDNDYFTISPPNNGSVNFVGGYTNPPSDVDGFDIVTDVINGTSLGVLLGTGGDSPYRLYAFNLTDGSTRLLAELSNVTGTLFGLTLTVVLPTSAPPTTTSTPGTTVPTTTTPSSTAAPTTPTSTAAPNSTTRTPTNSPTGSPSTSSTSSLAGSMLAVVMMAMYLLM